MRKKLLLLLLFIPMIKVNAYYCDYNDLAKYKKFASNITYSYEYEELDDVVFKITLSNLSDYFYLEDNDSNVYNYKTPELVVTGKSGETKIFNVYATDTFCTNNLLYTIRVNLPTYNKFYKDPICVGIENYQLCQKWSTHNLTYEKFLEKVTLYKSSLNKPENITLEENKMGILDYILMIWIDYYYVFLIIIILSSSIGIYNINKKSDIYK